MSRLALCKCKYKTLCIVKFSICSYNDELIGLWIRWTQTHHKHPLLLAFEAITWSFRNSGLCAHAFIWELPEYFTRCKCWLIEPSGTWKASRNTGIRIPALLVRRLRTLATWRFWRRALHVYHRMNFQDATKRTKARAGAEENFRRTVSSNACFLSKFVSVRRGSAAATVHSFDDSRSIAFLVICDYVRMGFHFCLFSALLSIFLAKKVCDYVLCLIIITLQEN